MMTSIFIKLNKLDLKAYRKKALAAGLLLILILALDLHRFGAWYDGNRSYVKTNWILICAGLSYPLVKYALAGLIQYFTTRKMFTALYILLFYATVFPISSLLTVAYFKRSMEWYEKNYFIDDKQFLIAVIAVFVFPLVYMVAALILKDDRY